MINLGELRHCNYYSFGDNLYCQVDLNKHFTYYVEYMLGETSLLIMFTLSQSNQYPLTKKELEISLVD
jgi:hypothetical protein